MVVDVKFTIQGFDELDRALAELGDELRAEVLTEALKRAAEPLIERAKQLAPRSGDPDQKNPLWKSIKTSRKGGKKTKLLLSVSGAASILVGPSAPHGHLVEFGHAMVTGSAKRPTARKARRTHSPMVIGHVPAHPFMRPAWDSTRTQVVESIKAQIGLALQRKIKSLEQRARTGSLSKKDIGLLFSG